MLIAYNNLQIILFYQLYKINNTNRVFHNLIKRTYLFNYCENNPKACFDKSVFLNVLSV